MHKKILFSFYSGVSGPNKCLFSFFLELFPTFVTDTNYNTNDDDDDDDYGDCYDDAFYIYLEIKSLTHCLKTNETLHRTMYAPFITLMVIAYNLLLVGATIGD